MLMLTKNEICYRITFFFLSSQVVRFTHIMCEKVENLIFEPRPLHKLSIIVTN